EVGAVDEGLLDGLRVLQGEADALTQITQTQNGHGRSLLLVLLDEFDGVGDLLDLLGILVRDLHAELLLEAHDELDQVQRIGVEVFAARRLRRYLLIVNAELLDDDLLESVEGCSVGPPSLAPLSLPDGRDTLPRTPFTRRRAASPAYVRARETASWIVSPLGVAAEYST